MHWLARSLDLTCTDYFLWRLIKTLMTENLINSADDRVAHVVVAPPGSFACVQSSMRWKCENFIISCSRNSEHLL
ncbi:hypothetical protein TNCV_1177561 [Trichonephila clavipes]|nr:hypothetical protein TNCV_1177561 [Trichonephila clavipes]